MLMIDNLNEEIVENLFSLNSPSVYFEQLKINSFINYYPELSSMIITPQDPLWHPEGSVWTHTMMVIDIAAELKSNFESEHKKNAFMLAALCHDIGKPFTTKIENGRITSKMHDSYGLDPAYSLLSKLNSIKYFDEVSKYIIEHLKPISLFKNASNVSNNAILRIADRINIDDLILLCQADHWGRTDEEADKRIFPAGDWLKNKYEAIINTPPIPKPLLKGKFLMKNGVPAGSFLGKIIHECIQLQKEGVINTVKDANKWALDRIKKD